MRLIPAKVCTLLVMVTGILSGCAQVTIPFAKQGTDCASVKFHPLCDADVQAAFPELAQTDVLLDVDSFDLPQSDSEEVFMSYTPEVIAPHTVSTKQVVCRQADDRRLFWCHLIRYKAYFYSKPNYYLVKGDDVSTAVAINVVRLMQAGKVVSDHEIWPGILKPENIYSFILHVRRDKLALYMRASGCSGPVEIEVQGSDEDQVLRIYRNDIVCH